jgi:hypothetical protein
MRGVFAILATAAFLVAASSGATAVATGRGLGVGQLAFHSEQNGKDEEIYLVDLAKLGAPVNLTNNPAKDVSPAWNPSGTITGTPPKGTKITVDCGAGHDVARLPPDLGGRWVFKGCEESER